MDKSGVDGNQEHDSRSRISRLERGHASLETGQQSLGREIGQLREALDSFAGDMRRGIDRIQQGRASDHRANYPLLLSTATVLLTLGAIVASAVRTDQNRIEADVGGLQSRELQGVAVAAVQGERIRALERKAYDVPPFPPTAYALPQGD